MKNDDIDYQGWNYDMTTQYEAWDIEDADDQAWAESTPYDDATELIEVKRDLGILLGYCQEIGWKGGTDG